MVYPFFLLVTFSLQGQNQKLEQILNLELHPGTPPPKIESEAQLQNLYYDNLHDIMSLIFYESDSSFEALKKFEDIRIEAIESFPPDSPWKGFLISEIKLQWAFIKLKYGEEWGAFWSLRSANKLISENEEDYPSFEINQRTSGLLNILFGVTPDNYKWVFNMFGMKGSVKKGIERLENTLSSDNGYGLEASIILGMVYSHLLENTQTAPKFLQNGPLSSKPLSRYFQGIILQKSHQAQEARLLWAKDGMEIPFEHYLVAESYFQEGFYEEAIQNYLQFLNDFTGTTYQKDTYLKIALSHRFLGQAQSFNTYFALAQNSKAESSEIDKNAQKILDDFDNTNLIMLQLRFAIDGGFLERTNRLISQLKSSSLSNEESIELIYREARLSHISGQTEKAISLYQSVIEQAETIKGTYYAPNSFLQMGYLQRDLGDIEEARMYFNEVLSFRKHPYKTSLDTKAKVAISLLSPGDE